MSPTIWSLILMALLAGFLLLFVALKKSSSAKTAWLPKAGEIDTHSVLASAMIHDAHKWYTGAKQEDDYVQALTRCSYGIALVRAVQGSVSLEDVKGIHLPTNIKGANGLLEELVSLEKNLKNAVRNNRDEKEQPSKVPATPPPTPQRALRRINAANRKN